MNLQFTIKVKKEINKYISEKLFLESRSLKIIPNISMSYIQLVLSLSNKYKNFYLSSSEFQIFM